MRNIAILEWGPASLYYVQPRETIRVRTGWLEGGPVMPPFLSTKDEAKQGTLRVRYALSYHENLDKVIQNLRRCFGFPYQEAIGFLNSLNRTHRVRREHEGLIDRLRQWAIFGNVDAIVWVDYEKANQRRGEFKLGPKDSRPFSPKHMELIGQELMLLDDDADDESDADRSEQGAPQVPAGGQQTSGDGLPVVEASALDLSLGGADGLSPLARDAGTVLFRPIGGDLQRFREFLKTAPNEELEKVRVGGAPKKGDLARITAALNKTEAGAAGAAGEPGKGPAGRTAAGGGEAGAGGAHGDGESEAGSVRGGRGGGNMAVAEKQRQHKVFKSLQPEEVPMFGSIYPRSIAPGPGHYQAATSAIDNARGRSFGYKPIGNIDKIVRKAKLVPGPGHYPTPRGLTEVPMSGGRMDEAAKGTLPIEGENLLPFLSPVHAAHENLGLHSPNVYYSVGAAEAEGSHGVPKAPHYSFGHTPRPFHY